jgi:hypothetical protein
MGIFPEELLRQTESELPPPLQLPGQLTPSEGSEIDQQVEQDVRGEDSISPAAEAKPEKEEEEKVKSKQDKASKKKKSKKAKKKNKKGKKKQAKKSKKGKKKKDKKN